MQNKKLSPFRVILAILFLLGVGYAIFQSWKNVKDTIAIDPVAPWFGQYVDVTATPRFAFEQLGQDTSQKNLVLAFIVSSKEEACTPSWGGAYTLDSAGLALDLDRRIARLIQRGGNVAISFGGLLNDELSVNCTDPDKLINAYQSVIDRYSVDTIDMDIEGSDLADTQTMTRRAQVLAKLQKMRRSEGKNLAIWLTLPVAPGGMTTQGTDAVSIMLNQGVDLAGVNVMTMDYGESKDKNQTMQQASESALIQTHRQLGILYKQAGINLSDSSIWSKIGATPMIGQNDIAGEIFSLDDAKGFNEFVITKQVARLSIWSVNRDIQCGENYVNWTVVSDSCSGVKQERFEYSKLLGNEFKGGITSNSASVTIADPQTQLLPDNPDESPYQIWSESATYLEGTKIVWHHNVYVAKWWTSGDLPDNPVLQSFETPWQLIGPVLPGEKPIPQPTLAPGTYPTWSGIEIYNEAEIVLFDGIAYQAKWWTQGDSPAASTSNPDSSPWKALTRQQVDALQLISE